MDKQEIYLQIQALLVKLFELDADDIKPESRLYEELELDSIDAVDLILKLKDFTGRKMQPQAFKHVRTVGDVVEAIYALVNETATT